MDREAWHMPWGHKELDTTEWLNWTDWYYGQVVDSSIFFSSFTNDLIRLVPLFFNINFRILLVVLTGIAFCTSMWEELERQNGTATLENSSAVPQNRWGFCLHPAVLPLGPPSGEIKIQICPHGNLCTSFLIAIIHPSKCRNNAKVH